MLVSGVYFPDLRYPSKPAWLLFFLSCLSKDTYYILGIRLLYICVEVGSCQAGKKNNDWGSVCGVWVRHNLFFIAWTYMVIHPQKNASTIFSLDVEGFTTQRTHASNGCHSQKILNQTERRGAPGGGWSRRTPRRYTGLRVPNSVNKRLANWNKATEPPSCLTNRPPQISGFFRSRYQPRDESIPNHRSSQKEGYFKAISQGFEIMGVGLPRWNTTRCHKAVSAK